MQLRASRELEAIKAALFQGGVTAETIQLLIVGAGGNDIRRDSATEDVEYAPKGHYPE